MSDIDKRLPRWKKKVLLFNCKYFIGLSHLVKKSLPWLLILLLLILVAEFGDWFFEVTGLRFFLSMFEFAEQNHNMIYTFDRIIIGFFIVDLYFNFFKKRTLWRFVKRYFLDIIAVFPVGLFFRLSETGPLSELGAAQRAVHVTFEAEKEVAVLKETRGIRAFTRIPRFLRLLGLRKIKKRR